LPEPLFADGTNLVYGYLCRLVGTGYLNSMPPPWMQLRGQGADNDGIRVFIHLVLANDYNRPGFLNFSADRGV